MLSGIPELIDKISSNTLDALEIKQGDDSEVITEADFKTIPYHDISSNIFRSMCWLPIKSRARCLCVELWPPNEFTNSNLSRVQFTLEQNPYSGQNRSTRITQQHFTLLNKTSFLKIALLPSEDYVVIGGEGGYVYIINTNTCGFEATHQFRKTDITHIKYDPKLNLFMTRSTGAPLSFFRYHDSEKKFSPVDEIPHKDFYPVLQSVQTNTSIKKLTLKDGGLDQKKIQCLYQLTKARPDLKCDFADSTHQKLDVLKKLEDKSQELTSSQIDNQSLKRSLEEKSKELESLYREMESLKLKHAEEEKAVLMQKDALIKENEEQGQEIGQLRKNEELLRAELKETMETVVSNLNQNLLEEKQKHALAMEESERIQKKYLHEIDQRDRVLKEAAKKSTKPLQQQLEEEKSLNQFILQQLIDRRQSIEYWSLIKFRDDKLLEPFLENMLTKKAIIDIKSLTIEINSVDVDSPKIKIDQLSSIIEELISRFAGLSPTIQKQMKHLITLNSEVLLSNPAAKKQYDAYLLLWKQKTYADDDDIDLATIPVPKTKKAEAISEILNRPNHRDVEIAIEMAAKEILRGLKNKLLTVSVQLPPPTPNQDSSRSFNFLL